MARLRPILFGAVIVMAILLGGLLYWLESSYTDIVITDRFQRIQFPEQNYFLYDLGVTDQNNDGFLDIFSANHYARQALLINNQELGFNDVTQTYRLNQTEAAYGLEEMVTLPKFSSSGLYIYWHQSKLYVTAKGDGENMSYSGAIDLHSPVLVEGDRDNGLIEISEKQVPGIAEPLRQIAFNLPTETTIVIEIEYVAVPITLRLPDSIELDHVFLGSNGENPLESARHTEEQSTKVIEFLMKDRYDYYTNAIRFLMKDRHGHLWIGNSSANMNIYIARGGLKGVLARQGDTSVFGDEILHLSEDEKIYRSFQPKGVKKRECSAHQVSGIDYNMDSVLDIYVACRRSGQPNQLYKGTSSELQKIEAHPLNIDAPWLGPHAWVPGDQNGPNLLYAHSEKLWLYRNLGDGSFSAETVAEEIKHVKNVAIADVNDDGIVNIFLSSLRQSKLLLSSRDHGYRSYAAEKLGLPKVSAHSAWVDVDNNGVLELHSIPGGLFFLASDKLHYKKSKNITTRHANAVQEARGTWFDIDNNGTLDFVGAVRYRPSYLQTFLHKISRKVFFSKEWSTFLVTNRRSENNWLQITLNDGLGGAASSGTTVEVKSENGRTWLGYAWQSEQSHASQGHYRLHFGLGDDDGPFQVTARWPDGIHISERNISANTLTTVARPPIRTSLSNVE